MKRVMFCAAMAILFLHCAGDTPRPLQIKKIRTNGISLAVAESGAGAETVVFLHFGGSNMMAWQGVATRFGDQYHLVFIDQRGHGQSDKPRTGNHIDTMAVDVLGVLDALNIKQAHIVGSSLGAEVGLSLAARFPVRVTSLTVEGALHSHSGPFSSNKNSFDEAREAAAAAMQQWRNMKEVVYDDVDDMLRAKKEDYGSYWTAAMAAMVRYGAEKLEDGRVVEGWRPWARNDYFSHFYSYRFETYYERVQCPVLMLPASEEWLDLPTRAAIERMALIPAQCRIEVVPGLMHAYGWVLKPDVMADVLQRFLQESPNRSAAAG